MSAIATGMLFLGLGMHRFEQGSSLRHAVVSATSLLLTFGSVVLMFYSRSYYRKTFGEVESVAEGPFGPPDAMTIYVPAGAASKVGARSKNAIDPRFLRLILLVGGFCIALYAALRMAGSSVDVSVYDASGREVPLFFVTFQQVFDLILGSLFLSTWFWRERRLSQSYYLVLGVVMMVAATFGAVNVLLLEPWPSRLVGVMRLLLSASVDMQIGQILCGICFVLAGLLDHWQLVRALRPTAEPHARPVVI